MEDIIKKKKKNVKKKRKQNKSSETLVLKTDTLEYKILEDKILKTNIYENSIKNKKNKNTRNVFVEFIRVLIGVFFGAFTTTSVANYYIDEPEKQLGHIVIGAIAFFFTFLMFYVLAPKNSKKQVDDLFDI